VVTVLSLSLPYTGFEWHLTGLNDLKMGKNIFKMIQDADVLEPLKMDTTGKYS
jgi:hypothetical protein